uniref:NADH-ubiquinone oxidoreductase chain 4L n=1 Tax=Argopistes tsekooni TaxID=2016140 RepID=A0A6C0PT17_9CUCU|nr:NADH dehydrogenase subunit 4L [Argopistes tsekooni]QHX99907.1 NADH dehydrogenase subunit 4L [Argopistes tsekooni]
MLMYSMFFMFFMGAMSFILNRKHLLLMLLSLEFIVIIMYLGLFNFLINMNFEFFFSMIFLTMSVCEGVLGLSILILLVRLYGNDYLMTFSSLW